MLRIVYVSWEYPPQYGGGIGTYVHAMARTLAARGHEVTVVTGGSRPSPQREIAAGVTIVRLPLISIPGEGPVEVLRSWQNRSDAVADLLQKLVRGGRVDLIEFCDYRGEGAAFLARTQPAQRPVCVLRLHTPLCVLYKYNTGQTRHAVLEEFENEPIRAADRVVSPSLALRAEMHARLGSDLPIDLSPHPVDPLFLRCDLPPAPPDRGTALYVGRLEERKGVETLIQAAPTYLEACSDARLVFIGGDTPKGPRQPSLRQILRDTVPRQFRDRVEFIDRLPREQLIDHYRAARLCVFPSHFENFPNTCLEAMALGACVIGTTNSGMAEMIADGVSGLIVPPADVPRLTEALMRLHRLPADQRQAMGAAAHRRIETAYHPDVIAAQMEAQYETYVRAHPFRAAAPAAIQTPPPAAVVIPCYNHGRFLPEALASVRDQRYPHVECVVVDDGSTEPQTLRVLGQVRDSGVRVIRQDNQGLAAARNTGVLATDVPFFVPLDADDRLDPNFIAKLLPKLVADPTLGYCYSHAQFFGDSAGRWECPPYDPQRLLVENLSVATAVVRRAAYDQAGGYSRDMVYGFEDWDFWIALLSLGYAGCCVPELLFHYRKHASGSMLSETQKRRAEMVHKMIEHHRPLFALSLEASLTSKDALFFQAHTDAWRLRQRVVQVRAAAPGDAADSVLAAPSTVDDQLYQVLLAKAELDHIENSRFWRLSQRLKHGAVGQILFGPAPALPPSDENVQARLAALKASRTYRLIQAVKRTPFYRWYGRRRYGSEFDRPAHSA